MVIDIAAKTIFILYRLKYSKQHVSSKRNWRKTEFVFSRDAQTHPI